MLKTTVRKRHDILSPRSLQANNSFPKRNSSDSILNTKLISIIECIIIIILSFTLIYYRSNLSQSQQTVQVLYSKYNDHRQKVAEQESELTHLREKERNLRQNGNNRPSEDDVDTDGNLNHDKNTDEWDDTDKQWIKDIQNNDYKSLRLRYGIDPIHVLIETNLGNIILEMADIRSMPHSVRYFLHLVENKFWNGCHFFRNAHHVIQANCHRRNGENVNVPEDTTDLGQSGSVVFQEYDDTLDYLHQSYSIGLAGRPGGPDFYINTVNNKRNHGPGGQGPKPDPCFANVVSGKDVVDRIHEMEHDGSSMMVLKEWVEFIQVSVIKG